MTLAIQIVNLHCNWQWCFYDKGEDCANDHQDKEQGYQNQECCHQPVSAQSKNQW